MGPPEHGGAEGRVSQNELSRNEDRQMNLPRSFPALQGDEPVIEVDEELPEVDLQQLFDEVQTT